MGGSGSTIKALLCAAVLLLVLPGPLHAFGPAALVGMRAPEFAGRDINGNYVSVTSMRGDVVLVNFWASWCPPCKKELPGLNRLYLKYRSRGVRVVAVSMESSDRGIRKFLRKTAVDFNVIHDRKGRISKLYGIYSIPTTVVVDRSGTVVESFVGDQDWSSPRMQGFIEELLKGSVTSTKKPETAPVLFFDGRKNRF